MTSTLGVEKRKTYPKIHSSVSWDIPKLPNYLQHSKVNKSNELKYYLHAYFPSSGWPDGWIIFQYFAIYSEENFPNGIK